MEILSKGTVSQGLREILRISQYSVRMWENTDQKNSEYGHFSGNENVDTAKDVDHSQSENENYVII